MKFNSKAFKELLDKLSSDPKIKAAIDTAKSDAFKSSDYQASSLLDLLAHLLKYSSAFVGKKKAEKLSEFVSYLTFLITISLLVKKNIFDKPEVREFFEKNWNGAKKQSAKFYLLCQNYAAESIAKLKNKKSQTSVPNKF